MKRFLFSLVLLLLFVTCSSKLKRGEDRYGHYYKVDIKFNERGTKDYTRINNIELFIPEEYKEDTKGITFMNIPEEYHNNIYLQTLFLKSEAKTNSFMIPFFYLKDILLFFAEKGGLAEQNHTLMLRLYRHMSQLSTHLEMYIYFRDDYDSRNIVYNKITTYYYTIKDTMIQDFLNFGNNIIKTEMPIRKYRNLLDFKKKDFTQCSDEFINLQDHLEYVEAAKKAKASLEEDEEGIKRVDAEIQETMQLMETENQLKELQLILSSKNNEYSSKVKKEIETEKKTRTTKMKEIFEQISSFMPFNVYNDLLDNLDKEKYLYIRNALLDYYSLYKKKDPKARNHKN